MADRLECIALSKFYGKKHVVKDVTFSMSGGEITGLLGPNGAGKTTSFYMIVGFIKANGGKILLNGEEITHLAMHERSKRGLAYLPQEASIFRKLTVEDNIKLILEEQKISRDERKRRLEELLVRFGIDRVRRQYGYTLSGGERRRTEIARALATSPKFLLLDEPFANLDYPSTLTVIRALDTLHEKGYSIIVVSHEAEKFLAHTDTLFIMDKGILAESGRSSEIFQKLPEYDIFIPDGASFGDLTWLKR